ncbi:MAG: hypothetical protein ACYC1Q_12465 [Bacteroidia bacterium]
MKKALCLAACVLFILSVFIWGWNCSSNPEVRIEKEQPGNRPVFESVEGTGEEDTLPYNALDKVLICKSKNAYAYHARVCQGLKRCKAARHSVTKNEAVNAGYRACKYCY